jgi:hypothetical protein
MDNDLEINNRIESGKMGAMQGVVCLIVSGSLFVTEEFLSSYESGYDALLNETAILAEVALAGSLIAFLYVAYCYFQWKEHFIVEERGENTTTTRKEVEFCRSSSPKLEPEEEQLTEEQLRKLLVKHKDYETLKQLAEVHTQNGMKWH